MVDNAETPERDSSPSLWIAAFVFSLVLHGVCIGILRNSRVATFSDDAVASFQDSQPVRVSVREDVPEIDPELFPELFPEVLHESPDEALDRLQDDRASLEESVRAFSPEDAGSMAWMPELENPGGKIDVDISPADLEVPFPEDIPAAASGETVENAAAKLKFALPAVAEDELISRVGGETAVQVSPVTAGTVSDVLKAAIEAAGAKGAYRHAGSGGSGGAIAVNSLAATLPDPFEMAEKPLAEAAKRNKDSAGGESPEDAAGRTDVERAAEVAAAAAKSFQAASPSAVTGRAIELPKVDEAFVARERAAVEALKDSQEGSELAGYVSIDFESYADPAEPEAVYFKVNVQNRAKARLPVAGKDLVILVDTSASIGTPRLRSCSAAISQILEELHEKDRFNLISFADDWTYAFDSWQENNAENRRAANKWTQALKPKGFTDVFSTISSILTLPRDPARPLVALVITDGDATKGVYQSNEILSRFTRINGGLASIYFYGVVEDANAYLMDILSLGNRGGWARHKQTTKLRSDIADKERCAAELPAFARTFSRAVISDFSVVFSRSSNVDSYPKLVSNLYSGSPVEIWGRCPAGQDEVVFELRGLNGATVYDTFFRRRFANAQKGSPEIKREWARRKISHLTLEYASSKSPAVLAEMHRLAEANGMEIPYEKELEK